MITVKYYGEARRQIGKSEEEFDCGSVKQVLSAIKQSYGKELYATCKRSHLIVNGENCSLHGGYSMKLKGGDELQILPVCGGG